MDHHLRCKERGFCADIYLRLFCSHRALTDSFSTLLLLSCSHFPTDGALPESTGINDGRAQPRGCLGPQISVAHQVRIPALWAFSSARWWAFKERENWPLFHAQNKEEKGCLATAYTIRLQRRLLLFFLKFSSECIWTCPEVVEEGSCVIYLGSPRSHTKAFPEPPHSTGDAGQLFSPSLCSNLAHTETKELTLGATKGQRDSGRYIS